MAPLVFQPASIRSIQSLNQVKVRYVNPVNHQDYFYHQFEQEFSEGNVNLSVVDGKGYFEIILKRNKDFQRVEQDPEEGFNQFLCAMHNFTF